MHLKPLRFGHVVDASVNRLAAECCARQAEGIGQVPCGLGIVSLAMVLLFTLPCRAGFTPLGDLPGGSFSSAAFGCSSDGSVVVGYGFPSGQKAFRWTAGGGMVALGTLPNTYGSGAEGCSGDGLVVVGQSGDEAFRWTSNGGTVGLGDLPGGYFWSKARSASFNGNVVVGYGRADAGWEAFRWTTDGGMASLGDLTGGATESQASHVSGDGSVVVGYGTSASGKEAFRWTADGGMVGLGDLPGGNFGSKAIACSTDGTIIVGGASSAAGYEAFRWTADGGMVGLGDLPGGIVISEAHDVSADGSVVVGIADMGAAIQKAFIWDAVNGIQSLQDVLIQQGDDLTGWTLMNAEAISDDGRTIVGIGKNPSGQSEAFVATIVPEPAALSLLALCGLALIRHRR